MISERIFKSEVAIDEIIEAIVDEKVEVFLQKIYTDDKVNTATSMHFEQEDVA